MKFSIRILRRSRSFIGVIALFIFANIGSWLRYHFWPIGCDQAATVGFPVPFHISDGVAGLSNFYVLGLFLDVTIALTIAVFITWIVRLVSYQQGH